MRLNHTIKGNITRCLTAGRTAKYFVFVGVTISDVIKGGVRPARQ